jgi:hypothetical protein
MDDWIAGTVLDCALAGPWTMQPLFYAVSDGLKVSCRLRIFLNIALEVLVSLTLIFRARAEGHTLGITNRTWRGDSHVQLGTGM